jgi:putative acetyltransferase
MPIDIRRYRPSDIAGIIALFRDTVRRINGRDYSPQQVMAWAPDEIDSRQWTNRFDSKAVWSPISTARRSASSAWRATG